MATDILIRKLALLPLFQGLTLVQLDEIARRGEHAVYKPGSIIIEEGAEAHAAVLIVAGEAARVTGPELKTKVEPIPSGSLLGEAAMLIETTYGSTIVARGHVRALHILREQMHEQMLGDAAVAERISANIAKRLTGFFEELRRLDDVLASASGALPVAAPTYTASPTALPAPMH